MHLSTLASSFISVLSSDFVSLTCTSCCILIITTVVLCCLLLLPRLRLANPKLRPNLPSFGASLNLFAFFFFWPYFIPINDRLVTSSLHFPPLHFSALYLLPLFLCPLLPLLSLSLSSNSPSFNPMTSSKVLGSLPWLFLFGVLGSPPGCFLQKSWGPLHHGGFYFFLFASFLLLSILYRAANGNFLEHAVRVLAC